MHRFYRAVPQRQRRSFAQYKIVKRVRGKISKHYGVSQKTVAEWEKRDTVADLRTGPKETRSTVLSVKEEAVIVAFRRHTLLPLEGC